MYKDVQTKEELKIIADNEYSEADMVVRLGHPFRQMATFNMQGKSKELGNDIVVKSKGFKIEVKLQKNYKSNGDGSSNSATWKPLEKDFQWLFNEIQAGNKGKVAFVLGWFNAVDRFSQIVQLGKGKGRYPVIDNTRKEFFPFLHSSGDKTKDITYLYSEAYEKLTVKSLISSDYKANCMFLGSEKDKFHIAIYW
ncbi:hypothetical protein [Sporosarcina sp. FSL K6-3457]|uniref:hypothetical protein n=1 Tax=Sporosarcina sp. FSL K6-3457 TaxID=2978204 RepID=UPI0030F59B82